MTRTQKHAGAYLTSLNKNAKSSHVNTNPRTKLKECYETQRKTKNNAKTHADIQKRATVQKTQKL